MRATVVSLLVLAACSAGGAAPPEGNVSRPGPAASGEVQPALLVTRRPGSDRSDSARILTSGPVVSTAGWTSWAVNYETNLTEADFRALEAQSDSVFNLVRAMVMQRSDTVVFMVANFRPEGFGPVSRGGGYRFLYRRGEDGSWTRPRP